MKVTYEGKVNVINSTEHHVLSSMRGLNFKDHIAREMGPKIRMDSPKFVWMC